MSEQDSGSSAEKQHRNDMYGNIDARGESDEGVMPAIPAATVVLLRDGERGVEVLMLRKNSKITFGGMWVFPGGKIDAEDYPGGVVVEDELQQAAYAAAVRETEEEAGIDVSADKFVYFAHWSPPPGPQKRFATWFFAACADSDHSVSIDGGEIKDHAWLRPADALARHAAGELDLVPPTWITLQHIARYSPSAAIIEHFKTQQPKVYATRVVKSANGDRVALWQQDAGYNGWDDTVAGARHRLVMGKQGFVFENTVEQY